MKKAVFLYDYTGIMAQPWLDAGYECWCFDGQHELGITREGNHVKVGMWFDAYRTSEHVKQIKEMVGDAEIVIGFPECTDLTVAGARHFKSKAEKNPAFQAEAVELARLVMYLADEFNCPYALENPVGVMSSIWRQSDFSFNPCDYSGYLPEDDKHPLYPNVYPSRDRYNKNTCIWSGNGFVMPERKRIEPLYKENPGWKHCGGKSLKTKNIRSATPRGFAKAVFEFNGLTL
ncbi:MAG: Dcm methylase [Pseudomonadota bacterium]